MHNLILPGYDVGAHPKCKVRDPPSRGFAIRSIQASWTIPSIDGMLLLLGPTE